MSAYQNRSSRPVNAGESINWLLQAGFEPTSHGFFAVLQATTIIQQYQSVHGVTVSEQPNALCMGLTKCDKRLPYGLRG